MEVVTRALLLLSIFALACTDEAGARRALDANGFSSVTLSGFDWWSCSKGDTYATKFEATNSVGKRVSGVVCCGVMKACTVRF